MRRAYRVRNRSRISAGNAEVRVAAQCSWAFELTLLTFCPPGPELRTNENTSSLRGMTIRLPMRTEDCAVMLTNERGRLNEFGKGRSRLLEQSPVIGSL